MKQSEIAEKLNISQQSINYWLQIIKKDYPNLLKSKETKTEKSSQSLFIF